MSVPAQSPLQPLKDQFATGRGHELDVRAVLIGGVAGAGVRDGADAVDGAGGVRHGALPATCTVSARCTSVKVAVTLRAWLIVTTQVPSRCSPRRSSP